MADKLMGVENLRLKFPGAQALLFKDLSLTVTKGEKVLFLGPSGCGKSTLLQILSGLIPNSIDIPVKADHFAVPESWGYLFQDPDTQFCMPFVDEEMAFVLENLLVPREQMLPRIQSLLHLVGLAFEDTHVSIQSLSQGMKQRLALASVLALEPEVLFLDEPTALLDPEGTIQIWETIKQLTTNKTVVIVEHKINEIMDYVDRVVLFNPNGEIVADGQAETIFSNYKELLIQYGIWYPEVWEDYIRSRKLPVPEAIALSQPSSLSAQGTPLHDEEKSIDLDLNMNANVQPVIRLGDFKGYRGKEEKIHIPQADLQVFQKEWITITGANGAGKSTLLLALMQLIKTTGMYQLKQQPVDGFKTSMTKEMAYVFQNPEFQFVTHSVFDEVAYSLKVLNVTEAQIEAKVQELLASFELLGREKQHPYQLSMGQKRRLSVASAVVQEQEILLLDEPTFGQDAKNTFSILEQLERLRRSGTTILMVTHDEEIVRHFATRIWEIKDGRLVKDQYVGAVNPVNRANAMVGAGAGINVRHTAHVEDSEDSKSIVNTLSDAVEMAGDHEAKHATKHSTRHEATHSTEHPVKAVEYQGTDKVKEEPICRSI